MASPYSISLLNDLHHHFPDLLYRPNQFRNVPDVLNYIIGVANRNPYEDARQARDRQAQQERQAQQAQENPRIQPHHPVQVRAANDFYQIMNRRAPRSDDLLSIILNDMILPAQDPPPILQNFFLNPAESIRLTNTQMEQGTILTRSLQRQEDNCAICQDPIEAEQMMRILRHCTHRFHQTCVDTWLTNHVSCPTCRHDIRE